MSVLSLKGNSDPKSPEQVIEEIKKCLRKPPQNSRVLTIYPEVAVFILETYNNGNRRRKKSTVNRYSESMMTGCWALTGDTIKFSDTSTLRDGQHRLSACIQSGVPFRTHVVFGIADDTFDRMDTGFKRSNAIMLQLAGVPNAATAAAAVRWLEILIHNPYSRATPKPEDIVALYRDGYSDLQNSIKKGQYVYRQYNHPTGQIAALHYLFKSAISEEKADEFIDAWVTGQSNCKAIMKMQTAIRKMKENNYGRVHDVVRAALIVRAWNCFVEGGRFKTDFVMGQDFPKVSKGK